MPGPLDLWDDEVENEEEEKEELEKFSVEISMTVSALDETEAEKIATSFIKKQLKTSQITDLYIDDDDSQVEDINVSIESTGLL